MSMFGCWQQPSPSPSPSPSSDGAQDLVDELADLPVAARVAEVRAMFEAAVGDPNAMWREVFPNTIIAAAALVAATLPGGDHLVDWDRFESGDAAALPTPSADLAAIALRAVQLATAPDGLWTTSWMNPDDAATARQNIEALSQVLTPAS